MTRRRWIADEVEGRTAALAGEHAAHLTRVLRAEVGQEFEIATSAGVFLGTITSISDASISEQRVEFALGAEVGRAAASKITLALAIFKFDRMEWAIEKCTEIGVARIIPVVARRSDAHLIAAAEKRRERWLRLVRQASEQSRRSDVPAVDVPVKLKALADAGFLPESAARIVLDESLVGSEEARLAEVVRLGLGELVIAVGPEGGWAEEELAWFRDSGWHGASLGKTILRAETAAIVGSALAMDAAR